jgi:hypothetical protein
MSREGFFILFYYVYAKNLYNHIIYLTHFFLFYASVLRLIVELFNLLFFAPIFFSRLFCLENKYYNPNKAFIKGLGHMKIVIRCNSP